MKKQKIIKTYFPTCPKNLRKYFKISWIDKSITELEDIYKTNNRKLNKHCKTALLYYIHYNYKEIEQFAIESYTSPLLYLAFNKCLNLLENIELYSYLLLTALLILKKTETSKKFPELKLYCERKLNDSI